MKIVISYLGSQWLDLMILYDMYFFILMHCDKSVILLCIWVTPWAQDVNWTYIKRSEDAQGVFWKSYVRSIYVVCPRGMILNFPLKYKYAVLNEIRKYWKNKRRCASWRISWGILVNCSVTILWYKSVLFKRQTLP